MNDNFFPILWSKRQNLIYEDSEIKGRFLEAEIKLQKNILRILKRVTHRTLSENIFYNTP